MAPRSRGYKVSEIPRMAERFDPANEQDPATVAARSVKIYRWRCPAGPDHVYMTSPASVYQSGSNACPFCTGRAPSVTNRLDTLYPAVAEEWDVELNGGPPVVTAKSMRKAWWRCPTCGHRWQAVIRSRTVLGVGCPECAPAKISAARSRPKPGRTLPEVAPKIAAQWHPTRNGDVSPADVAAGSNEPRWWLCDRGHEWSVPPTWRVGKDSECPHCCGRYVTEETSLTARFPGIAAQWHPTLNGDLTPDHVMPGSEIIVWWRCPAGHDYDCRLPNRTSHGRGCPFCSGQRAGYGNDLETTHPEVAAEWDYERNGPAVPWEVTPGSGELFWWRCAQGHSWRTTVNSRVGQGTGCPQCGAVTRRSRAEILLQHELGHVLPAKVTGDEEVRTRRGAWRVDVVCRTMNVAVEYDGCYWHKDKVERDTEATRALVDDGWIVVRVRQVPLPVIGSWDVKGQQWPPDPHDMTVQVLRSIEAGVEAAPADHPARELLEEMRVRALAYEAAGVAQATKEAEKAIAAGKVNGARHGATSGPRTPKPGRSLAEMSPVVAAEWHPELNGELTAWDVVNGRNEKAWWKCSLCGRSWESAISNRTVRGTPGCPDCSRKRVAARRAAPGPGESLAEVRPDLSEQWHPFKNPGLRPEDVRPNSDKIVWWRGRCGHDWPARVRNRHNGQGCRRCWLESGAGRKA